MPKLRAIGNGYGLTVEKDLLRQEGFVAGDSLTDDYFAYQQYEPDARELSFTLRESRHEDVTKLEPDGRSFVLFVDAELLLVEGYLANGSLTGEYYCPVINAKPDPLTVTYLLPEPKLVEDDGRVRVEAD